MSVAVRWSMMSMDNKKFKALMCEFMDNKENELDSIHIALENRIDYRRLNADDYHALLINETQRNYADYIFYDFVSLDS